VTYPDHSVAAALNQYFIPVQVNYDQATELVSKYRVVWTPHLSVLGGDEFLAYRVEGWLPPADFAAMLMVGSGHFLLKTKRFEDAATLFLRVAEKYPTSSFAPEALYYCGVSRFSITHKLADLMAVWSDLRLYYGESQWSTKTRIV